MGRAPRDVTLVLFLERSSPTTQSAMAGRSTKAFDADATLVVVVEMSRSVWLVAGLLPGIERRPLKKMTPDENELTLLLERWRGEVAATLGGRCGWLLTHVWTARRVQGVMWRLGAVRLRSCVRSLLMRHHGRRPRWVPRAISTQLRPFMATGKSGLSPVGSTDCHLLLALLNPWHQRGVQAVIG